MSGGVPAGWVLVPEVATEAMERAAFDHLRPYHDLGDDWQMVMPGDLFRLAWPAMLAAAPATPTPPIEGRDADVERVARALCEYQIRQARRWDTDADVLEAMLPAAITHGWPSFMPQARAALQALGERP